MTKRTIALVCALLSFMTLFLTAGYAAITDTLNVSGDAEVEIPSGLYIVDISSENNTYIDRNEVGYMEFTTTVESISSRRSNRAGVITHEITIFNNTKLTYAYRGLYYQSNVKNNSLVTTSSYNANSKIIVETEFPDGSVVLPGETLTFYATYTLGRSLSSSSDYTTILNYQFGINVETEAEARDVIHSKFIDILNTSTSYETLVDNLDNKFDGRQEWTSNYIGNVGSATSDDAVAVNTLFSGQLQMIINGVVKPASVIIKHENLDGNNMTGDDYVAKNETNGGKFRGYGCEMTLYLTTAPLNNANGEAEVYVCVFTCDRDANGNIAGDWYQIGDSYRGFAPVVGYNGESGGTGSFVTDNWVASAESYSPSSNYTYSVSQGQTIKDIVRVVDDRAIDAFQELLDDSKAIIDDLTYAGVGIKFIEDAYKEAYRFYTVDNTGKPTAKSDITRAQLCPTLSALDHALSEAKDVIENLPKQE